MPTQESIYIDYDNAFDVRPHRDTHDQTETGSLRRYGIELEYNWLPEEALDDVYADTEFGAKEDCSVDAGEFVSPPMRGDSGLEQVRRLCEIANAQGWVAGRGAGFHIHLDMTDETAEGMKSIALAYHYTSELWNAMIPRRRRAGNYTYSRPSTLTRRSITSHTLKSEWTDTSYEADRYEWFSTSPYSKYKTFELRLAESSCDPVEITDWIKAHTRFCDAVAKMTVGKITRLFGNGKPTLLMRELRIILKDSDLSDRLAQRILNHK
jgi:hypothetical protein